MGDPVSSTSSIFLSTFCNVLFFSNVQNILYKTDLQLQFWYITSREKQHSFRFKFFLYTETIYIFPINQYSEQRFSERVWVFRSSSVQGFSRQRRILELIYPGRRRGLFWTACTILGRAAKRLKESDIVHDSSQETVKKATGLVTLFIFYFLFLLQQKQSKKWDRKVSSQTSDDYVFRFWGYARRVSSC